MALPLWYYRGRTTTPIETAAEGSFVLVPRQKFRATLAEVSHLRKLGLVVRMEEKAEAQAEKKAQAIDLPPPKSEGKAATKDDSSEPESKDAVIASTGEGSSAEGEGEGESSKPMEKEQETASRKGRRGQRRS